MNAKPIAAPAGAPAPIDHILAQVTNYSSSNYSCNRGKSILCWLFIINIVTTVTGPYRAARLSICMGKERDLKSWPWPGIGARSNGID